MGTFTWRPVATYRWPRTSGSTFEAVVDTASLTDRNGIVLATVPPMFVSGASVFTLFEFPVAYPVPATSEGTLTVEPDKPSGLPENDFRVTVPLHWALHS
jgi:hypothetical protein